MRDNLKIVNLNKLSQNFNLVFSMKFLFVLFIYELPNKLVGDHNLMLIKIIIFEFWTCRSYFAPALCRRNPKKKFSVIESSESSSCWLICKHISFH